MVSVSDEISRPRKVSCFRESDMNPDNADQKTQPINSEHGRIMGENLSKQETTDIQIDRTCLFCQSSDKPEIDITEVIVCSNCGQLHPDNFPASVFHNFSHLKIIHAVKQTKGIILGWGAVRNIRNEDLESLHDLILTDIQQSLFRAEHSSEHLES
jgi:hypothetical protein